MNLGRPALIMMVDDTPANLSVLSDLLSARGFKISVAEDGESALEQLQYVQPDLILLDVLMPHLDGFTTCRRLKERLETRDIPIIFMTALTDTVEKVKGFELGAVDYITKPFQQEEVLARVNAHLALQQLKARLKESEARLERIIDSAMDAIIAVDDASRILLFNCAAERVFRCQAAEAIGGPFQRFLSEALCQVLTEYMSEAGPKTQMWVREGMSARRADGESFSVEATFSRAETNGRALYTVFLRDVQERQRLRGLNLYLQGELRGSEAERDLIGASEGLRAVMKNVRQVAATDASVLLLGETGTGKQMIARAIHASSTRKDQALVTLNCAAIPKDLVESELFGHEKGAFTGALARRLGRFELADKGTLFSTSSASCPWTSKPSSCACSRNGNSSASVAPRPARSMFGSSPPPTATSHAAPATAASAPISTTGSMSSPSPCRPCATARRTCRSSSSISCVVTPRNTASTSRPSRPTP